MLCGSTHDEATTRGSHGRCVVRSCGFLRCYAIKSGIYIALFLSKVMCPSSGLSSESYYPPTKLNTVTLQRTVIYTPQTPHANVAGHTGRTACLPVRVLLPQAHYCLRGVPFCGVMPCSPLELHRLFEGKHCLHHPNRHRFACGLLVASLAHLRLSKWRYCVPPKRS